MAGAGPEANFNCAFPPRKVIGFDIFGRPIYADGDPLLTCCAVGKTSVLSVLCLMRVEAGASAPFDGMATPDGFYPAGNTASAHFEVEKACIDRCIEICDSIPFPSSSPISSNVIAAGVKLIHPNPITARPGRRITASEVASLYPTSLGFVNLQLYQLQNTTCPTVTPSALPEYAWTPDFWNISAGSVHRRYANGSIWVIAQKARVVLSQPKSGCVGTFNSCTNVSPFSVAPQTQKQVHVLSSLKISHTIPCANNTACSKFLLRVFRPSAC